MSSSTSNSSPNFPDKLQFDGTKFVHFETRVLMAACACGAKGYLKGTVQPLNKSTHTPIDPGADKKPPGKPTAEPGEQATSTTTTIWTLLNLTEEWDLSNA
ncbi:hypothetical protein H2248_002734 [Termitomyces sp. 'cryptogamus']|nr:hypothetical protein H2248_002734 [Termitomyces sp. 'cryptogamus']